MDQYWANRVRDTKDLSERVGLNIQGMADDLTINASSESVYTHFDKTIIHPGGYTYNSTNFKASAYRSVFTSGDTCHDDGSMTLSFNIETEREIRISIQLTCCIMDSEDKKLEPFPVSFDVSTGCPREKDYVHSYLATPISKMPEVIWGGCKDYSDADDCWINTWKAIDEDGTIYPQACEFAQ